jgi:hypothetical protein
MGLLIIMSFIHVYARETAIFQKSLGRVWMLSQTAVSHELWSFYILYLERDASAWFGMRDMEARAKYHQFLTIQRLR